MRHAQGGAAAATCPLCGLLDPTIRAATRSPARRCSCRAKLARAAGGRVSEGLCTRPPRRRVPHAGAGHRAGISEDGRQEQCTSTEGRRQQGQEQAGRFRGMVLTYTSVDGHTILVGQSAFENEQLCHRAAQQGALQTPTGCT